MPAIQDAYSVNVSNRFALALGSVDLDPLEELQTIEEQSKRQRELKKKVKTQQQNEKPEAGKKDVQFKENKDANVLSKKSSGNKKDDKLKSKKEVPSKESSGQRSSKGGEKEKVPIPSGDENRRPRRQNNQRWEKPPHKERFGEGDQYRPYDDSSDRPNRRGPGNADNDDRMDRRDRGGSRYERYRGNRGGFRGSQSNYGYRGNSYRSDGRDDRGKREFDRRSGSDKARVRAVDKRDGAGPRNWGTPGNEIEETVNPPFGVEDGGNWADQVENEEQEEKQQKENAEREDKKEATEVEQAPKDDEEVVKGPEEMTLDEWKAKQNTTSKKKQFKIRKPGEGEDSSKWSNMKMIHEPTVNKPVLPPVTHDENPKKAGGKQSIDDVIRFDMPPRSGRGGRGGRGFRGGRGGGFRGGRGGGGRYGNRYENQHAPPPDVLNEKEFPTLSAA